MRYPYFHIPAPAAPALSASERAMTHKPDQKLLELLQEALRDEAQTAADYTALAQTAPEEAATLILPMAADEMRHAAYLRELYEKLTNQTAPEIAPVETSQPYTEKILCGHLLAEWEDARDYRALYLSFLNRDIRDVFFELMTDEMLHGQTLLHLLAQMK